MDNIVLKTLCTYVRPLTVSFLIRASGKSHSQAGSARDIGIKKWSLFVCFSIRNVIFWHMKTGTFGKSVRGRVLILKLGISPNPSMQGCAPFLITYRVHLNSFISQDLPHRFRHIFPSSIKKQRFFARILFIKKKLNNSVNSTKNLV